MANPKPRIVYELIKYWSSRRNQALIFSINQNTHNTTKLKPILCGSESAEALVDQQAVDLELNG
ncbi:MAG: hypothetical protein AAF289_05500 [Cyanobacteria bacterium P01_A01_bin.135]